MTMLRIVPLMVEPDCATLLVTMAAMYVGAVEGGLELAPGVDVHDQALPHCGGDVEVELA
jgi:hypothetical protein